MKIMMHNTKVRLPKAPIVLPIIEMSKLSVGHDFANLNTRSCKYKLWNKASHKLAYRRFTYATAAPFWRPTTTQTLSLSDDLSDFGSPTLDLANVCLSYLSKMCVDLVLYEWDICYSIFYCNYLSIVLFCESFSIGCFFIVTQFYLFQPLWSSLWPNVIDIDPISCRPDASKYPR